MGATVVKTLRATSLQAATAPRRGATPLPVTRYLLPVTQKAMSITEQEIIKQRYYDEAMRYIDNAKENLKHAKKDGQYYNDQKYVRTACGTAYNGVLIALDCFLMLKGVKKPTKKERKSVEYYHDSIGKIDRKMLNTFNSVYKILHLWGYYDGIEKVSVVKDGFDEAAKIINKIKPKGE